MFAAAGTHATGLPVSKWPGTVVHGRWLSTRLRHPSASTPFVWLCDMRRPTYTDHLRRPVLPLLARECGTLCQLNKDNLTV